MDVVETTEGRVTASLERLADRVGDPTLLIYQSLFQRHPDYEDMFVLDTNGDVRGEMLSQAFDMLMRADVDDSMADVLVKATRFAHDGYNVSEDQFDSFFETIRDVTKRELGGDWNEADDAAWTAAITRLLRR